MKNLKLIALYAMCSIAALSSCKKDKDDAPAPTTTPAPVQTSPGTFTVNGAAQTPKIITKNVYTPPSGAFTQVVLQNDKYNLKMEFTNATLASGEYTITSASMGSNMYVNITFYDLITKETTLVPAQTVKAIVNGGRITISTITIENGGENITLAADFTVK